jgi:hypothetical protein
MNYGPKHMHFCMLPESVPCRQDSISVLTKNVEEKVDV